MRNEFIAQAGLSDQILAILRQLLEQQQEPAPAGWARIFPDYARAAEQPGTLTGPGHYPVVNPPLVYPGELQGQRNRQPTTWDGYVAGSADDRRKFATGWSPHDYTGSSAPDDGDELVWVPDEFESVEEYEGSGSRAADTLWPPQSREQAEQAWAKYFAAAGQADDYTTETVHEQLFGDGWFSDE
jgi:hypothetical protein